MICEREDEIAAFVPREYWTIDAEFELMPSRTFPGKLVEYGGAKVEQFTFTNEADAREVERTLIGAARRRTHGARRRAQTAPPQSGAAVHDIDLAAGGGAQARLQRAEDDARRAAAVRGRRHRRRRGRLDHLHAHRLAESRAGGGRTNPRSHRPPVWRGGTVRGARVYRTKSKNAQEAHEAIRPTSAAIVPGDIERQARRRSVPAVRARSGSEPSPARWRRPCSTRSRWTCSRARTVRAATCCARTARRW